MSRATRRQGGFTLLELLIAVALFALLGLGTWRLLEAVLQSDQASARQEQALRQLSRALWTFERDLLQASPRPIRDAYGDERVALFSEARPQDGERALELTRGGWRNPAGTPRSSLQRVRWRLRDGQLERLYWNVLDRDVASQPRLQPVLDQVVALQLRFLDEQGRWHAQWPPAEQQRGNPEELPQYLPQAVELTLEHARYGQLQRLLRLPQGPLRGQRYEGLPEGVTP